MVPRILKALGFRFWSGEVWHAKSCIIVDGSAEIVWSGPAVIEYQPGDLEFEGGTGKLMNGESGELVLDFRLTRVIRTDRFAIKGSYWRAVKGAQGLTLKVESERYGRVTIYLNTHAASFVVNRERRKAGLIKVPAYEEIDT